MMVILLMRVVSGVTTDDPAMALKTARFSTPVVISKPPIKTKLPVPPTKLKPPCSSEMAQASVALSKTPSALASAKTVLPFR